MAQFKYLLTLCSFTCSYSCYRMKTAAGIVLLGLKYKHQVRLCCCLMMSSWPTATTQFIRVKLAQLMTNGQATRRAISCGFTALNHVILCNAENVNLLKKLKTLFRPILKEPKIPPSLLVCCIKNEWMNNRDFWEAKALHQQIENCINTSCLCNFIS